VAVGKAQVLKRALLGRTMGSYELEHTLFPKLLALPVFSSDPLSSNAYATQEILLVLAMAGGGALGLVNPIALAVAVLLGTVVVSYRQTVRAYPNGGGAYIVAHENLGTYPGLLAAAALQIDYVLTVSVSITAGVDAIVSAIPGLADFKVQIAIAFIAAVTLANLRGAKESGTFFAIPTYGFVLSIYIMLAVGFARCLGGCPQAQSAGTELEPKHALTLFLVLKAFSAGTTALTGVEAISNGVPAFRYPQSRNAATTLSIMGVMSITMFLGISWLADAINVVYIEGAERTVVAQLAAAVFGEGAMFYILQAMTAAILILAANTAYQDFPRLSSILARDHFLPRQFMNRGDRLVFSNGIVILAVLSSILVILFDADLNQLIQLYLVGVFISFTLSQAGMVVHWRRSREQGWSHRAIINGVGAVITGIVFVVVVTTKFATGAWIVVTALPFLILMMRSIHKHYGETAEQLADPDRRPPHRRPGDQHMIIFVTELDAATARAVGYVRSIRPNTAIAVTTERRHAAAWRLLAPEIPVELLDPNVSMTEALRLHVRARRRALPAEDFLTIVMPELLQRRGLVEILLRPRLHRLKGSLLAEQGVQVLDIPIVEQELDPHIDEADEPVRNYAIVLVAGVHNAALEAIEYAQTLRPSDVRAVSFGLEAEKSEQLADSWIRARIPVPLELEYSPFRDIGKSVMTYVRQLHPDGVNTVVTVVIPEFVVSKTRHQFLHGQTALLVKRHLLFETGVVVASVPYHLESPAALPARAPSDPGNS
jgi:amino acid transporter